MSEDESKYDVLIVGSGPSGRTVASHVVKNGMSIALIDAELVGGDCAYWACVPSKALLRPPEALEEARRIEGSSEAVDGNDARIQSVFARLDRFLDNWDDSDMMRAYEGQGVKVIHGRGELAGKKRVNVRTAQNTYELTARCAVVIGTLSSTASPARAKELKIRVVDCELDGIPGAALHTDGYSGHARVVVDEELRVMVGATFLGPEVGDLIHAATVAVVGRVPMDSLWHAIPCFPTVNEAWMELLETYRLPMRWKGV